MEWYDHVIDAFNDFTEYFQSQALPVQIMMLAVVISVLVGVGFLIYGVLWCVYQIVKAAVVGTIITVYLTVIGIMLLIMLMSVPDKVDPTWKKAVHNIKWFANRAWPPKEGSQRAQPVVQQAVVQEPIPKTTIQKVDYAPITRSKAREVPKELEERKYYCTSCGAQFTQKMNLVLSNTEKCFCEQCGTKFNATDGAPAAVF